MSLTRIFSESLSYPLIPLVGEEPGPRVQTPVHPNSSFSITADRPSFFAGNAITPKWIGNYPLWEVENEAQQKGTKVLEETLTFLGFNEAIPDSLKRELIREGIQVLEEEGIRPENRWFAEALSNAARIWVYLFEHDYFRNRSETIAGYGSLVQLTLVSHGLFELEELFTRPPAVPGSEILANRNDPEYLFFKEIITTSSQNSAYLYLFQWILGRYDLGITSPGVYPDFSALAKEAPLIRRFLTLSPEEALIFVRFIQIWNLHDPAAFREAFSWAINQNRWPLLNAGIFFLEGYRQAYPQATVVTLEEFGRWVDALGALGEKAGEDKQTFLKTFSAMRDETLPTRLERDLSDYFGKFHSKNKGPVTEQPSLNVQIDLGDFVSPPLISPPFLPVKKPQDFAAYLAGDYGDRLIELHRIAGRGSFGFFNVVPHGTEEKAVKWFGDLNLKDYFVGDNPLFKYWNQTQQLAKLASKASEGADTFFLLILPKLLLKGGTVHSPEITDFLEISGALGENMGHFWSEINDSAQSHALDAKSWIALGKIYQRFEQSPYFSPSSAGFSLKEMVVDDPHPTDRLNDLSQLGDIVANDDDFASVVQILSVPIYYQDPNKNPEEEWHYSQEAALKIAQGLNGLPKTKHRTWHELMYLSYEMALRTKNENLNPAVNDSTGEQISDLAAVIPDGEEAHFAKFLTDSRGLILRDQLIGTAGDFDPNQPNSFGSILLRLSASPISERESMEDLAAGAKLLHLPLNRDYLALVAYSLSLGLPWSDFVASYDASCLKSISLRDYLFFTALAREPSEWQGVERDEVKALIFENNWVEKAFRILDSVPPPPVADLLLQFLENTFSWVDEGTASLQKVPGFEQPNRKDMISRCVSRIQDPPFINAKGLFLDLLNRFHSVDPNLTPILEDEIDALPLDDPNRYRLVYWVEDASLPSSVRNRIALSVPQWITSQGNYEQKRRVLKATLQSLEGLEEFGVVDAFFPEFERFLQEQVSMEELGFLTEELDRLDPVQKAPWRHRFDAILIRFLTHPESFQFVGWMGEDEEGFLDDLKNRMSRYLVRRLVVEVLSEENKRSLLELGRRSDSLGMVIRWGVLKQISGNEKIVNDPELESFAAEAKEAFLPTSVNYDQMFPPGKTTFKAQIFCGDYADGEWIFDQFWKSWFREEGFKKFPLPNGDPGFLYTTKRRLYDGRLMNVEIEVRHLNAADQMTFMELSRGEADFVAVMNHSAVGEMLKGSLAQLARQKEKPQNPAVVLATACWSWHVYGSRILSALPNVQFVGTDADITVGSFFFSWLAIYNGLFTKKEWSSIRTDLYNSVLAPAQSKDYLFPNDGQVVKYLDFDRDGIPDTDDDWVGFPSSHPPATNDEMLFRNSEDLPRQSLAEVVEGLNGLFYYDPFLSHFIPLRLPFKVEESNRYPKEAMPGWFKPAGGDEELFRLSEVIGPEETTTLNSQYGLNGLAVNGGYQDVGPDGLKMMLAFELASFFARNFKKVGKDVVRLAEPRDHLEPEEQFWAFMTGTSLMAMQFHFRGGYEDKDFTQRCENLFTQYKKRYGFPDGISWEMVTQAHLYDLAMFENLANEAKFVKEKEAKDKLRGLFI